MTDIVKTKTRPAWAIISQGTALGTSSIIDTTAWQSMQLMAFHGGTGGSRTISVYVNGGTQMGTAATTLPNPIFVGSANSDQAGAGTPTWICGSLTDQAVVSAGTSSNSSFSVSYVLFD